MTIAGEIVGFAYWYEGLTTWWDLNPATPPDVPLGKLLFVSVQWRNTGSVSCQGHMDLTIIKPDGVKVTPTATINQDLTVSPGPTYGVQFAGVTLDVSGTYKAKAVLSMEAVAAPPPSPTTLADLILAAYAIGQATVVWGGVTFDVNSIVLSAQYAGISVADWLRAYGYT